jgi:hypothetical protein
MENILFDTFVYLIAICFICYFRYHPNTAVEQDNPLEETPLWSEDSNPEISRLPDPWQSSLKPVQKPEAKHPWQPQPVLALPPARSPNTARIRI